MNFRLDRLAIHNFRCFSECSVAFHPDLTVLIADNGQGKTAILDGAAVVLGQFVDAFTECRQSVGITKRDVRLARAPDNTLVPLTPTQIKVGATFGERNLAWMFERKQQEKASRQSKKALSMLLEALT